MSDPTLGAARRRLLIAVVAVLACTPSPASAAPDPLRSEQWNLDAIGADIAHRTSVGSGALVAVLDSGVDSAHPDLAGNIVEGGDFIDGDATPNDLNGHGTHVTGIIAAHEGNGIGVAGAAPGAKVLAIRVLDANNSGDTHQEAAGIDAAVKAGADVINLSLSPGSNVVTNLLPSDVLVQAIERAARAGAVVVAAAGNEGLPLCAQPVLAEKILCVGAVNRSKQRSSFSNYALRVDIVAPGGEARAGEAIFSTRRGGDFSGMAGTSQATPQVSAAAALLVSLGLRGKAVIDRLLQTATDLGAPTILGHGLLNMAAAVGGFPSKVETTPTAELTAQAPKRARLASVRRRGLPVVCTSPQAGSCAVRVTSRGRTLARGSSQVAAGVPTTVRARLTPTARRTLARERARRLAVRVKVSAPPASPLKLATTIVR